MSANAHAQEVELQAVHQPAESSDAQRDDARLGSTTIPESGPGIPASAGIVEGSTSNAGGGPAFHVDLYGSGLRTIREEVVREMQQESRATQTTPRPIAPAQAPQQPAGQPAAQQPVVQPAPQRRPTQQQLLQRRRRARIRWRLWLTSKIYVIKIALASRRGKMITTCTFAFVQITAIIALLIVSGLVQSTAAPGLTQWQACPRNLQAFDIIQVAKAIVGWVVNVWWIRRQPLDTVPNNTSGRWAYRLRQDVLPYFTAILHIVLSAVLFSTLTGSPTAWNLSPTIFFACIVALFRTWLAVAEVVLLVVGGALYAICYASLAIFCPGIIPRRAARIGGINPTIGPLNSTQLDQIPIVQYASMSTISLALPSAPASTLGRLRLKRSEMSQVSGAKGPKRYKIEKHRAACAICLNDFVDMKRVNNAPPIEQPRSAGSRNSRYGTAPSSPVTATSPTSPTTPTIRRRSAQGTGVDVEHDEEATIPVEYVEPFQGPLSEEDASRPPPSEPEELRLLPCEHVFHTECIDPWLKDVSGRCPTCQRPVFGGDGDNPA